MERLLLHSGSRPVQMHVEKARRAHELQREWIRNRLWHVRLFCDARGSAGRMEEQLRPQQCDLKQRQMGQSSLAIGRGWNVWGLRSRLVCGRIGHRRQSIRVLRIDFRARSTKRADSQMRDHGCFLRISRRLVPIAGPR